MLRKTEDRLQVALEYIEDNLSEPLSVAQVSQQVHMAESTFSRFFHSNKGITFKQYLIEQRVRQAARYLVSTDWSIATISAEVGFSSLSNFNAKFKNLLRVTPKKIPQ
ncbi:AraC family transcriptional regulator [Vibrio sinaloensis]|nr:AraC family transcriptional regulator [Vibrio sinaloensis]